MLITGSNNILICNQQETIITETKRPFINYHRNSTFLKKSIQFFCFRSAKGVAPNMFATLQRQRTSSFVTVPWLQQRLGAWRTGGAGQQPLTVLHAQCACPTLQQQRQDTHTVHIATAQPFNIDSLNENNNNDTTKPHPHMLPTGPEFAHAVSCLGVTHMSTVVLYDTNALRVAPRIWWMFRVMGHDDVKILQGGLDAWVANDAPVEPGAARVAAAAAAAQPGQFRVKTLRDNLICDYDTLLRGMADRSIVLIDARSPAQYDGLTGTAQHSSRQSDRPNAQSRESDQTVSHERVCGVCVFSL